MDNKKIIEKALKGEDYSADTVDFTPEQKTALGVEILNAADAAAKAELAKVNGLRQEGQRIIAKTEEEKKKGEQTFTDKLRDEQIQKAKTRFYSDKAFPITEEQKVLLDAEFKRLDTGKIDADLIFNDLKKAYVAVNADTFLAEREKSIEDKANAARYNAGASFASHAAASPDGKEYSQEAKAAVAAAQKQGLKLSLDAAEKVVKQGMDRKFR